MATATWHRYRTALDELYAVERDAERGAATLAPDVGDRADRLIEASAAAGDETANRLASDDPAERELAGLQLIAGAAADLLAAGDLAAAEEPPDGVERSAAEDRRELFAILEAEPGQGMRGFGAIERSDGAVSRDDLLQAADDAVADVLEDAGKGGQALVVGILALDAPQLADAARAALQDLLGTLADKVTLLLRKAVALVVRAVQKLMHVLGNDAQQAARTEAAAWVEKLKGGDLLGSVLSALYDPKRIHEDVSRLVPEAGADLECLAGARDDVEALAVRFTAYRKAMQWLARGLALLKHWMMALTPWGPIAWVGVSLAGVGFIGYLGGDYVDWHRTDRAEALNLVPGMRAKVAERFAVPAI